MPQIGPLEVLVVGVIALLVFGPQRLPEIARTLGRTLNEFRRQASDIRSEFQSGLTEVDDGPEDERAVPIVAPTPASEDTLAAPDGPDTVPGPDRPTTT